MVGSGERRPAGELGRQWREQPDWPVRLRRLWGYTLRSVDTLTGADAIEGLVLDGGAYWIVNDGATHPGTPVLNRVLRYAV